MANGIEHEIDEQQANELYWGSDESVNRIADRLGLSKGSLYAAIKPKPSDSMCPLCGGQLGYANRTALDRGTLSCAKCDHDFNLRADRSQLERGLPEAPASPVPPESPVEDSLRATTRPDRPHSGTAPARPASKQLLLGTTLLALGTGLLVSRFVNRN